MFAGFAFGTTSSEAVLFAAVASSAIFALCHIGGAEGFVAPRGVIETAQLTAKVLQAFLFGLLMTALYLRTGSLAVPIAAHVLYDLVYFAPIMLFVGVEPVTYLTGSPADCVTLCASLPAFIFLLLKEKRSMSAAASRDTITRR